jgi:hypothetical protein
MPEHAIGCDYWSAEGSPTATCSCGLWTLMEQQGIIVLDEALDVETGG